MDKNRDVAFFSWMVAGLFFALLASVLLFALWPVMGPFGMLISFAVAFGCLFRGIWIGFSS